MPLTAAMLSLYYLCDQTAATRPLSQSEMAGCMQVYARIKHSFGAEGADPAARNRAAYAAFKAWERENASLVAGLRAAARDHLRAD